MDLKKRIINRLNLFLLCQIFILLQTNVYAAPILSPIVCQQQYALCTSAPCTVDPNHRGYAICECDVLNGYSVGYKPCVERARVKTSQQTKITSTFSFAQFSSKKFLSCPAGLSWTNCLDSSCIIDPNQSNHAKCDCLIETKTAFKTLGGDCKMDSCKNTLWSGATDSMATELRNALNKTLKSNHEKPGASPAFCGPSPA